MSLILCIYLILVKQSLSQNDTELSLPPGDVFQGFEPDLNQLQIRSVEGSSRATSQTHGRLPRHVSLEKLPSVLWCMDLWPASGPARGQTWDLIYPLFAPISSAPFSSSHAFVLTNALSLRSVESTAFPPWRLMEDNHRCSDSTFLCTFFKTTDTFYWKHVKRSVNTNWKRELFFFFFFSCGIFSVNSHSPSSIRPWRGR